MHDSQTLSFAIAAEIGVLNVVNASFHKIVMMDREWQAGGRAFRRAGLALERSLCNWICKGIVQRDKNYLYTEMYLAASYARPGPFV